MQPNVKSTDRKKKVGLFLVATPEAGGTFQHNQSVLEAMAALPGDQYSVVVGYDSRIWEKYLSKYNCTSFYVKNNLLGRVMGRLWRVMELPIGMFRIVAPYFHPIIKALVNEKCDIWIFPTQDPLSFQAPVPALGSILDMMHRYEPSFPEVSANGIYKQREYTGKHLCRWSKGVLVDSELGRQMVHESYGTPLERIYALPCIAPKYIHESGSNPDFGKKYLLPPKYIFYPAQFWMHKNHIRLINAVAKAREEYPDINLALVGAKKNGYNDVVRRVEELKLADNVFFMGYVPDEDIPEFYRRARGLIMPTFFGPTNIPPLEAFVLGCPVATSNIYGIPDQVGDAALLFDPKSVEEMAGCIKRLWADDALCNTLAAKGRLKAAAWGQPQFNAMLKDIIDKATSATL